jgi:hypothetical protein
LELQARIRPAVIMPLLWSSGWLLPLYSRVVGLHTSVAKHSAVEVDSKVVDGLCTTAHSDSHYSSSCRSHYKVVDGQLPPAGRCLLFQQTPLQASELLTSFEVPVMCTNHHSAIPRSASAMLRLQPGCLHRLQLQAVAYSCACSDLTACKLCMPLSTQTDF